MTPSRPIRLGLLLTAIGAAGGIQRFNRLLLKAATAYVEPSGGQIAVLSVHDAPSWHDPGFVNAPVPGCGGNRAEFVARALRMLAGSFDAVLTDHVDLAPIVWCGQLRQPGRPWAMASHGIEVWGSLPPHERLAMRRATLVAAVSAYTRDQLVERHHVDQARTLVLPNALDPGFGAAFSAPVDRTRPVILAISRLDVGSGRYKGIDTTIESLPTILARVPDATLVIVGEGDDRARLEERAAFLGVSRSVRFTGRVTDAELRDLLSSAAVFALPSRGEGFGIVYLEAMAHGLPVVGGDHGGAPEVVRHGETGFLVPHGDIRRLADALVALLTDDELRARMGAAGRELVQRQFTYPCFEQNVVAFLDRLLGVARRQ